MKYFLRKYEILLTQYEICPWGILRYHFVMIKIQMGLLYEQLVKLLFEELLTANPRHVILSEMERSGMKSKDLHTLGYFYA